MLLLRGAVGELSRGGMAACDMRARVMNGGVRRSVVYWAGRYVILE